MGDVKEEAPFLGSLQYILNKNHPSFREPQVIIQHFKFKQGRKVRPKKVIEMCVRRHEDASVSNYPRIKKLQGDLNEEMMNSSAQREPCMWAFVNPFLTSEWWPGKL